MLGKKEKKKCFVITPIGKEGSKIRKHIERVIEEAIKPALCPKYDIVVAHTINEVGGLMDQIIEHICLDELVIANLTERNPNVMYELAARHSRGKPVILIAEHGTDIPSDISSERVFGYHYDKRGLLKLKKTIKDIEKKLMQIM